MKRWIIACLVIVLAGVALVGLARRSGEALASTAFDEILAYELSGAQDVVLSIPGKVERLSVTSWSVVPPTAKYDAAATYTYAVGVLASDFEGKPIFRRNYFQTSRVSTPAMAGQRDLEFVARLADGSDWVTDPRTTDIDLTGFHDRGGRVRLAAAGAGKPRLLVRVAFSQGRGSFEKRVIARSLDPAKRRLIVEGRASLGFGDLPLAAQERALASWGRRIGALGSKGDDYVEQRLLLGKLRQVSPPNLEPDLGMDIGPQHSATLNLEGPLTMRLVSDRDTEIELSEGSEPSRILRVIRGFGVSAALSGRGLRTVKLKASTPAHVRFQISESERPQQIGDFAFQPARNGNVEVGPDVRSQRYFRMHPLEPIRVHVARGQELLGLTVRAVCQPQDLERQARVTARWREQGRARSTEMDVTVTRSEYDRFPDVGDASDASWLQFQVPIGVEEVEFTGSAELTASVWTREPLVSESLIHPAYAGRLAEDEVFRNAPYQVRTWAPLSPDNADSLVLAGRELSAAVQVRIENRSLAAVGRTLPERALLPVGTPLRRELLVPARLGRGLAMPAGTWTPIRGATPLRIEARGPEAARLSIRYRLGAQPLGDMLRLLVDGKPVHEQPLLLANGTLERPVAPGVHVVSLEGLLEGSMAYAQAAPANGGEVVKSYSVFELTSEGHMDFEVDQRAGQFLKLILFVTTEGAQRPFQLSYAIDGGRISKRSGSFYRQKTEASGLLQGKTGSDGSGHLWEALSAGPAERADGIGRVEVRLGDDLRAGRHLIRIRPREETAGDRVFVRAVVVGQAPAAKAGHFGLRGAEPF